MREGTETACRGDLELDVVAYTYNPCYPSYSGGGDWEDQSSRPALVKSYWDPISKKTSQVVVVCICNPSYVGGTSRKFPGPGLAPGQKHKTLSKK
jgi:hypothetical protein